MKKRILTLAAVLMGAAALVSCSKMKEGTCVCTITATSDTYNQIDVREYPYVTEDACKKMEATSTSSSGTTVVIKCNLK